MTERPIIFNAPMVRAILEGRKTQTRRVAKFEPLSPGLNMQFTGLCADQFGFRWTLVSRGEGWCWNERTKPLRCPCGQPGDLLWVREAWQAFFDDEVPADRPRGPRHTMGIPARPDRKSFVFYKADGPGPMHPDGYAPRWKSPMHMPRKYSRITLEVTGVRVERLQDISEADAIAEGIGRYDNGTFGLDDPGACMGPNARVAYMRLWDWLHGPGSWAANPWVWVIEFRRIKP